MGIETIAGLVIGGLAAKALAPKPPKVTVPTPEKPPQASKAPDRAAAVGNNATAASPTGALAGNSSTFLTGPSGVDPSTLNLGRNTLLGQ